MSEDMQILHTGSTSSPFYDEATDSEIVPFKLDRGAFLPRRSTEGAVGYDLFVRETVFLKRGVLTMVDTGVHVESPVPMLVIARSSLCKRGIMLGNSVGLIDPDYRGTIRLPLVYVGMEPGMLRHVGVELEAETAVAQLVFFNAYTPLPCATLALSTTVRGDGGFGSTGN